MRTLLAIALLLASASAQQVKVTAGTVRIGSGVTDASTTTFTNKTIDCEGTGNVCTITQKIWLEAAGCQNTTASLMWDTPTSNAAAAACVGSNVIKGVADYDAATDESMHRTFHLPADWTGNVDVKYVWSAAATSGTVRWGVRTVCIADGEDTDTAFANTTTFAGTPNGTTNRRTSTSQTAISMTGCAAGESLRLQVFRDADGTGGTDDMTGDARLEGIEVTIRRAI